MFSPLGLQSISIALGVIFQSGRAKILKKSSIPAGPTEEMLPTRTF